MNRLPQKTPGARNTSIAVLPFALSHAADAFEEETG